MCFLKYKQCGPREVIRSPTFQTRQVFSRGNYVNNKEGSNEAKVSLKFLNIQMDKPVERGYVKRLVIANAIANDLIRRFSERISSLLCICVSVDKPAPSPKLPRLVLHKSMRFAVPPANSTIGGTCLNASDQRINSLPPP